MTRYSGIFKRFVDTENTFKRMTAVEGRTNNTRDIYEFPQKIEGLPSTTQKLIEIINQSDKEVIVYDIGGSAGLDYFRILPYIDKNKVRWRIYEINEVVQEYSQFVDTTDLPITVHSIDNLFVKKNEQVLRIFHSAGTLQYMSRPYNFLGEYLNCFDYFIFREMNICKCDDFVTIQEGIGPCWFLNKDNFIKLFKDYHVDIKCGEHFRNMSDLPKGYRTEGFMNFIFEKNGKENKK